jgi:putative oxidoreductase
MDIKKIFAPAPQSVFGCSALLLLRLVAGTAFILHGWGKIQNPFGWMGADASVPGIFQALAAIAEFGGGIAWILGLVVPLASFGLLCTMAVAVSTHAFLRGDPFVGHEGSYEPAAVYFCVALVLMIIGPGCFSLDQVIFGKGEKSAPKTE